LGATELKPENAVADRKALHLNPMAGRRKACAGSMTKSIYNVVKLASGWFVYCDGAKIGGTYGSKEAALEAAAVAAALAVRDGAAIQINVPGGPDHEG
jgi:hypothetical protein